MPKRQVIPVGAPKCVNRYCNVFQLLTAFSARGSTAPEAARRLGMSIKQAEGAASRLRRMGFIEHIPDQGYYITPLGREAIRNTPEIYAPKNLTCRYGRKRLIQRLQDVKCRGEKRVLINDIIERLKSEYTPTYKQARIDALGVLFGKTVVKLTLKDVDKALKGWMRERYKLESDLEIRFTGDDEHPIEVSVVCQEKPK